MKIYRQLFTLLKLHRHEYLLIFFVLKTIKCRDPKTRRAQASYYKAYLQKLTEALTCKNNHHIQVPNMGF